MRDGSLWTSAGVTAGIDLALAIVEHDHGRELALDIARWLVVYLHRPGGQSQFSAPLRAQVAEREPLRDVLRWMHEHPASNLGVPALAKRAGMSERNFSRVFRREVGTTPAAHAENVRVEAARRALETTSRPLKRIAADCRLRHRRDVPSRLSARARRHTERVPLEVRDPHRDVDRHRDVEDQTARGVPRRHDATREVPRVPREPVERDADRDQTSAIAGDRAKPSRRRSALRRARDRARSFHPKTRIVATYTSGIPARNAAITRRSNRIARGPRLRV